MPAEKMSPLELIKLYGKVKFSWDLEMDTLIWEGPISKILVDNRPLHTGSGFLNCLTSESFWKRFEGIASQKTPQYQVVYEFSLPDHSFCTVRETAEVVITQGRKLLKGYLEFLDDHKDYGSGMPLKSGYDPMTGFPAKEVLLENLSSIFDQSKDSAAPGGYLVFSLDRVSWIFWRYGIEKLRELVTLTGERLRKVIRFNDFLGRTSGICYGIVLKDTDEWGVYQAAQRIVSACNNIEIENEHSTFKVTISVGGASFAQYLDPIDIMYAAEASLFEVQNQKGVGIFVKPDNVQKTATRPEEIAPGKRRLVDDKTLD